MKHFLILFSFLLYGKMLLADCVNDTNKKIWGRIISIDNNKVEIQRGGFSAPLEIKWVEGMTVTFNEQYEPPRTEETNSMKEFDIYSTKKCPYGKLRYILQTEENNDILCTRLLTRKGVLFCSWFDEKRGEVKQKQIDLSNATIRQNGVSIRLRWLCPG